MRKTKIVATLGPASSSSDVIDRMIAAGLDVARLNFSHGTHEDHAATVARLRAAAQRAGRPLALLQDLQGPKIRTGSLEGGGPVALAQGQKFAISTTPRLGTAEEVSTTYAALPRDVKPGDRILLSDGLIELRVLSSDGDSVQTEVVSGGSLRQHQGINLPGVAVSAPALTDKDIDDLAFGLDQGVDYVALSFVRRASDLADIKARIAAAGRNTPVIAKIEKPEALEDMEGILALADGIMVARGDMGVEMAPEEVPIVQKQLIAAANTAGKPVITATEMLQSMIQNPRPTRAEASDVANAIIDGTDAVMLSGETAIGQHPVESVAMMARIALAAERSHRQRDRAVEPGPLRKVAQELWQADSLSATTLAIAPETEIRAIVAFTVSGATARRLAQSRPRAPIIAFTPSEDTYRRLALVWGVEPVRAPYVDDFDQIVPLVNSELLQRGHVQVGDSVCLTGGYPVRARTQTNFVLLQTIKG
ncbi:MAG: pyruvate kinase [Anaerolineae bacterium]